VPEYLEYAKQIETTAADTYRYLNFHQMSQYTSKAANVIIQQAV
jgi:aconitate hydratase 2/2-methylisocitrate dehydratase